MIQRRVQSTTSTREISAVFVVASVCVYVRVRACVQVCERKSLVGMRESMGGMRESIEGVRESMRGHEMTNVHGEKSAWNRASGTQ